MSRCVNCGLDEKLKIHYIVPLELGGNDIDSNKVLLCSDCYKRATAPRVKKVGRPGFILDTNTEKILDEYFKCKIGTAEAKGLIGISLKNKSTWQRLLKEYRSKHNIIDSKNNIDTFKANARIGPEERSIGYVKMREGIVYEFWNTGEVKVKDYLYYINIK